MLERLAEPSIGIVSMTITEGGYRIAEETGQYDLGDAMIAKDLADPRAPRTVFGVLTEAMRRRRDRGIGGVSVVSCDNLRHNGETAELALTSHAHAVDPGLADWIRENVSFPNSMVDRIVPAATPELVDDVARTWGLPDRLPVLAETHLQWVIEDRFMAGRPELERVGVSFRDDVWEFEELKSRILNASHVMLCYPALLLGYSLVDEAIRDPDLARYITTFLARDVQPQLAAPAGVSVTDYADEVLRRFRNAAIGDQLTRIAGDGAAKLPTYISPPTAALVRQNDADTRRIALFLASYRKYVRQLAAQGDETLAAAEPNLTPPDRRLLLAPAPERALASTFLAGFGLAGHDRFTAELRHAAEAIETDVRQALAEVSA